MVRESRLLWDNPSLRPDDTDRLRRLEQGVDDRLSPLPPHGKRSKKRRSSRPRPRDMGTSEGQHGRP